MLTELSPLRSELLVFCQKNTSLLVWAWKRLVFYVNEVEQYCYAHLLLVGHVRADLM